MSVRDIAPQSIIRVAAGDVDVIRTSGEGRDGVIEAARRPRLWSSLALALALVCGPTAAQEQLGDVHPPAPASGGAAFGKPWIKGRWEGPVTVAPALPTTCHRSEIAHVTLLPVDPLAGGERQGKMLIISECEGYQAHVIDSSGVLLDSLPSFLPGTQSMFCSGHTWVLRGPQKEPRFLVIGGQDNTLYGSACTGSYAPCASNKTALFDPLQSSWTVGPDLPQRLWYPSISVYRDGSNQFAPIALGGTELAGPRGCTAHDQNGSLPPANDCSDPDDGEIDHQFQSWWTLPPPFSSWEEHGPLQTGSTYWWQQYPRTLLLSTGEILCAGHAILCEDNIPASGCDAGTPGQGSYGGNPIQIVDPRQSPPLRWEGPDPNLLDSRTRSLNYCNSVILHTLKRGWDFEALDAASQYHLDRVIISGGSTEAWDSSGPAPAQPATLELDSLSSGWIRKADPERARVYGNLVILPDASLLALGGQTTEPLDNPTTTWNTPERFEPGTPRASGRWSDMAPRRKAPGFAEPTPRVYHSVAILLADGRVAALGGRRLSGKPPAEHTLELYDPPYLFGAARPRLLSAPESVSYGQVFDVTVDRASAVDRACLIGIGAVTHHFDYGQRYVELMARAKPGGSTKTLEVRLPDEQERGPEMLPEGYYLLFVVDERPGGKHLPSEGAFVKVSF